MSFFPQISGNFHFLWSIKLYFQKFPSLCITCFLVSVRDGVPTAKPQMGTPFPVRAINSRDFPQTSRMVSDGIQTALLESTAKSKHWVLRSCGVPGSPPFNTQILAALRGAPRKAKKRRWSKLQPNATHRFGARALKPNASTRAFEFQTCQETTDEEF